MELRGHYKLTQTRNKQGGRAWPNNLKDSAHTNLSRRLVFSDAFTPHLDADFFTLSASISGEASCSAYWSTVADFLSWMNYSSVSCGDRESRESADLQRTFILAVIQPEREREGERGTGMLRSRPPAIQTHTLMLIKP